MTVTAQAGVFSFAPQAEKVGDGTFTIGDETWYRLKTTAVNMGAIEDFAVQPMEIGGGNYPTGAYKAGVSFGGTVSLLPRLEGDLGWLFYAALGSCQTTADTPESGMYQHTFLPAADATISKWIATRKYVPGSDGANAYGEAGYDCKVVGFQLDLPNAGQMGARIDFQGRVPVFAPETCSDWTYADGYEDYTSIPLTTKTTSSFKINNTEYPIIGASFQWSNGFTTPQQERIIGSPYPDDFAMLTRSASFNFTYKWANAALYNASLTGSSTGTTWDPTVLMYETDGNNAIEVIMESPDDISGMSNPYKVTLVGNKCTVRPNGPPQLQAGGMIAQQYTVVLLEPDSDNYFEIILENEQSAYTWPT